MNDDDSLGGLDDDEHDEKVENLVQTFMDMANHSAIAEIPVRF